MKVLIPLCGENRVCKSFEEARMFALVHFDVQARRVFNWSLVCAPSGSSVSLEKWVVQRKPDLVVASNLCKETLSSIYSFGIEVLSCDAGTPVRKMIDRILKGRWMPEVFDYRHMKSNAEILHK